MTNEAIEAAEWECFSDLAYYDMWCVRQVGSRTFGEGFHLVNGDEAKMLCRFLNTRAAAPALMEEGARLALEAAARIVNGWRECDWPEGYHPHAINDICEDRAMRVRALDPAAIVKGAGEQ